MNLDISHKGYNSIISKYDKKITYNKKHIIKIYDGFVYYKFYNCDFPFDKLKEYIKSVLSSLYNLTIQSYEILKNEYYDLINNYSIFNKNINQWNIDDIYNLLYITNLQEYKEIF